MHTIKLQVGDESYEHIMYLLHNLKIDDLKILNDSKELSQEKDNEIVAFSNHSAQLVEEWQDASEDEIWK